MEKRKLKILILIVLFLVVAGSCFWLNGAAVDKKKESPVEVSPGQVQAGVEKALDFMAKKGGGSWLTNYAMPGKVVIAAICGLSFMANGSTTSQGKYANGIRTALGFVRSNIQDKQAVMGGGFNQVNWSLGIGGVFMAEVYQSEGASDSKLKEELQEVCDSIFKYQETSGGWGHGPGGVNPLNYIELNIVGDWCLATLGICRQLGIEIKDEKKIDLAIKYLLDSSSGGGVGYSTRPGQKGFGSPSRTGATIFAFSMLGQKNHSYFKSMAGYVKAQMPYLLEKHGYAHGSPALGMLGCGLGALHGGDDTAWKKFAQLYSPRILAAQNEDGSFQILHQLGEPDGDNGMGVLYPTAMYALTLQLGQARLKFIGTAGARPCDEKVIQTTTKCPACNKFQFGYSCSQCKKVFSPGEIKGAKKCPSCQKDLTNASLITDNKCFFCKEAVDASKNAASICIKEVYACPAHQDERHLKPGKCQIKIETTDGKNKQTKKCDQILELIGINIAEKITAYRCGKCRSIKKASGICCGVLLTKEKFCEKTGAFPHINVTDWEEFLTKKNK